MKDTLTTTETARLLGFHVNTLKNWVRDGKMPAFKTLGGHYRIRVRDLVQVLRDNGTPVPPQLENRYTVMVIDEDAAFQSQMKTAFSEKSNSFIIKPYLNGIDALVDLGRKEPDLIMLNIRPSGMDGFDLLKKLKANPDIDGLKVLAVAESLEDTDRALTAGATDVFVKSDGLGILIEKIKKVAEDKYLDFPTV